MRLLHVVASYLPAVRYGGTIVSVHGLCRALAARGHEVHVFTTSVDGPSDSPVRHGEPVMIDGVHVWYFRSSHLRRLYWAPAMAAALDAQVQEFDVVHSHAIYLWPGWAAARRARRAGVPYVISPRGMLEQALIAQKNRLAKTLIIALIERRLLERAAAIHVTSAREADKLKQFGFRLPPIADIPNGVDSPITPADEASVPPALRDAVSGGSFALFLGRISWKKGLDRLIAALPHAPGVRVIVAGNDDEAYTPALRQTAARLLVSDRVHFVGPVYGAAKSWLMSRASFLIVPSYSENFGNVVLEALAQGRPALMTPEVGVAALVERHGAGVVAEGSPEVLGRAMSALHSDPRTGNEMGQRGRAWIERDLGWPAIAARVEAFYETIRQTSAAT